MIGIIGAMEQEVKALLDLMENVSTETRLNYVFHIGTIAKKDCVLVQGGIGKVNAAVSATLLLEYYNIENLINIGSAGGLLIEEEVGDVVISTEVAYHDFDCTPFNYNFGQVPQMPATFSANDRLIGLVEKVLGENQMRHHQGLIVSGDQFIAREEQVSFIKSNFPEALCADMEATAIAQVCFTYKVPFIITRSLSDIFGKGNNEVSFDKYLEKASSASAKMCYKLIELL